MTEYLLSLSCPDRTGLIYAVTRWLLENGCNVLDSDTYKDPFRERFFMRVHFSGDVTIKELRKSFDPEAEKLEMRWELVRADARPRVLIMVSKHLHCILDLLNRVRLGQLAIDIPLIVSTAHYVTAQLDDGPIIAQDVQPAGHRMTPDGLAAVGKDIERVVLARAVQYHAQKRVLINGRRTVVFR